MKERGFVPVAILWSACDIRIMAAVHNRKFNRSIAGILAPYQNTMGCIGEFCRDFSKMIH
jgi:hypothetical protein